MVRARRRVQGTFAAAKRAPDGDVDAGSEYDPVSTLSSSHGRIARPLLAADRRA